MFGYVFHPQSLGEVQRANGTLKSKLIKIVTDSWNNRNWVDALCCSNALMSMRSQANRTTHLTLHEMLMGRLMQTATF